MMKIKYSTIVTYILVSLLAGTAYAKTPHELVLVNHYNQPLKFIVGLNPEVLPDLPVNFTLNQNAQVATTVIDINKEAYIRTEDTNNHHGFFGVNVENNQTNIRGYVSKGIAFSWNTTTVTFCTPEEYKKNQHC